MLSRNLPAVLLFDVNETLLELTPLEESIDQALGEKGSAKLWFTTMLQYALVMTVSKQYAPLPDIGAAILQMLARNQGSTVNDEAAKAVLEPMQALPPHPDVVPALEALRKAGFRLAALTNSSQSGVEAQTAHAGIADYFERQLSVQGVGKYKPHSDVYSWAVSEMGVAASGCMLVAAHGWDVAGAKWAGLQTAFIARPGKQIFPLCEPPDISVTDLIQLAKALITD